MTLAYLFNILGILVLISMLFFQVWNLAKYRDTNGAQKKRIAFLLSTLALIVHEIRLMLGVTTGAFLLAHIVLLLLLFDMVRVSAFVNWFKGKVK